MRALSIVEWRASWMPWLPVPAPLLSLLAQLPVLPPALAAIGAVLNFNPRTLRARLAKGPTLRLQLAEAAIVAAVPLWLQILVAPIAAVYILYTVALWIATEGLPTLLGRGILFAEMVAEVVAMSGLAAYHFVAEPIARGLVAAANAAEWAVRTLITDPFFNYVLAPIGRGFLAVGRAVIASASAVGHVLWSAASAVYAAAAAVGGCGYDALR